MNGVLTQGNDSQKTTLNFTVLRSEDVTVPAGEFQTFVIRMTNRGGSSSEIYYSTKANMQVKELDYFQDGNLAFSSELLSYNVAMLMSTSTPAATLTSQLTNVPTQVPTRNPTTDSNSFYINKPNINTNRSRIPNIDNSNAAYRNGNVWFVGLLQKTQPSKIIRAYSKETMSLKNSFYPFYIENIIISCNTLKFL